MKSILGKRRRLADIISPPVSAIVFYLLSLFILKKGEYLPGIQIYFLFFAIPLSYLGVLFFGYPGLWLLNKLRALNIFSFLVMSFLAGFLTVFAFFSGVALLQKIDNLGELYSNGLEPMLIAALSATVGALVFAKISDILGE